MKAIFIVLVVVCAAVILSEAHPLIDLLNQPKSCQPNDTLLHFANCLDNPQVTVQNVSFLMYPIDLHRSINLTIYMYNNGDTITAIRQAITVEWYGQFVNCGWHGLISLNDVDGCAQLGNCPQPHGQVVSQVNIDTAPYEGAIDLIPFDRIYLRFTIDSKDQNGKAVSCARVTGLACKFQDC